MYYAINICHFFKILLSNWTTTQAVKDAKLMRNKSWPLWETWKSIFGNDRASGVGAKEIGAIVVRLRAQVIGGSQVNENDYHPSFEDFIIEPYTPMAKTMRCTMTTPTIVGNMRRLPKLAL